MEFGAVLKQAWRITWRHKILWIFGLFAGGLGGGASGAGNFPTGSGDVSTDPLGQFEQLERAREWLLENLVLVIALGTVLVLLGLVLWVVGIAARGGLVRLVHDAEEGREVRAVNGWSTGFRMWGRLFLLGLVLYTPLVILAVLIGLVTFGPMIAAAIQGVDPTPAIASMCGGILIGGLLLLVSGFVAGLLHELGVRHAVIADQPALRSIGLAWGDVRSRFKDVFVMWLILVGVGIAYGIGVGVIGAVFGLVMLVSVLGGAWLAAVAVGFVLFLVLLLPTAIYSTFYSAVWTLFYRRLTGREALDAEGRTGFPPPPPAGFIPPAPVPPVPPRPSDG